MLVSSAARRLPSAGPPTPHGAGGGEARTAWHPGTAAATGARPVAAAAATAAAAASPSSSWKEEGLQGLVLQGGVESHFLPSLCRAQENQVHREAGEEAWTPVTSVMWRRQRQGFGVTLT